MKQKAFALQNLGSFEEALENFRLASKHNPKSFDIVNKNRILKEKTNLKIVCLFLESKLWIIVVKIGKIRRRYVNYT